MVGNDDNDAGDYSDDDNDDVNDNNRTSSLLHYLIIILNLDTFPINNCYVLVLYVFSLFLIYSH
jgi:hypothetical protein